MSNKKQYFGTDGVRGLVGDKKINPERMMHLGYAAGKVLAKEGGTVLIGKDTRLSGYMIESALEAGLSAAGMNVALVGPLPTPGIAYLTRTLGMSAGIVISASHNPHYDNGIKFFNADGMKLGDDIELEIESLLQKDLTLVSPETLGKADRIKDAQGRYIEFCKSTFDFENRLNGLTIVVDCANGATYHIAPYVLRELGATVIELSVEPDGTNINHKCGSTHTAKLEKTVKALGADIGIAFDGDGDRVIMVDHMGEVVDGDEILYVIAKDIFTHAHNVKGGVVGTVMSNLGLELALAQLGIEFTRTNVGDRYIIQELKKREWLLGGESSGHIICWRKLTTGDGIVASLQVLSALLREGKSLHAMKQGMIKYPQLLVNVPHQRQCDEILTDTKLKAVVKEVEQNLANRGRVLLRASGTEPVIRVMVEGEDHTNVKDMADYIADVVRQIG